MNISFSFAVAADAPAIAALHNATSAALFKRFGPGHWENTVSERGVVLGISTTSKIIIARLYDKIVGTCRLATKKPWAIDAAYFTPVSHVLYLVDMAVAPHAQCHGIGRQLIAEALRITAAWPAGAIRLDAYDADAGAGGFYQKCGFIEKGRVTYRSVPLVYYEYMLQPATSI